MSWTPDEFKAFKLLSDKVRVIEDQIKLLLVNLKNCSCDCKIQPYRNSLDAFYYIKNEAGVSEPLPLSSLFLNDKFPGDNICIGEKGELYMYDAVIHTHYVSIYNSEDENSGWQIEFVSCGGTIPCA